MYDTGKTDKLILKGHRQIKRLKKVDANPK